MTPHLVPPNSPTRKNNNKIYIDINEDTHPNLLIKSENASSSNLSEASTMVIVSENGKGNGSNTSLETTTSSSSWTDDPFAKYYLLQLLTIFYLVILVIYGIVLELSGWLIDKKDKENLDRIQKNSLIFNLYLYIVAFIFFIYSYLMFFLKQKITKRIWKKIQHKIFKMPAEIDTSPPEKHVQSLPVVGSFYLRFGAFIFAIVACVYYIFSAHWGIFTAVDICAIIFTIFQTHLLFFSSTMFDEKVYIISCFGTMHLVAVNLITWVQFLFAKNQSTEKSIAKYFKKKKNVTDKIITGITTTISSLNSNEEDFEEFQRSVPSNSRSRIPYNSECKGLECVFGSFTKVFYTAVVEYSLIAAVVMFIVWHNLGRKKSNLISGHGHHEKSPPFPLKKLFFGLLWGLLFVIGTALSMIFFYVNWYHDEHKEAAYNFNITDIVQNGIGMIACIFAFWRLRLLDFAHHSSHDPHHDIHANQELLDMILLAIGIIGELAFSISGLAGICSNKAWNTLTILLAIARILRIIQSIFQTFLIAFASKLKSTDPDRHPGRQTITFLIILNMAMFIYQWFISDKAGTYEGVISLYGEESWAFFVSIFSPLTVFFRFHSSVCFVEIWKHTYAKIH